MADDQASSSSKRGRGSKVARLIDEYDLEGVGEELEASWVGPGERKSLRDLETVFNRELITAVMREAGEDPLPGEVETIYEGLRSETARIGLVEDVRGRLDRIGIDVEELERSLVSYQAIRTYLTEYREVSHETPDSEPTETTRTSIEKLTGRLQAVTEQRLSDLANRGELTLGEFRVLVNVQVYCEECGTQQSVEDVLTTGGCSCADVADEK